MSARVLDVRDAEAVRPGQQAQTIRAAHGALENVNGASCVVLLSFVRKDDGDGWLIEVGVSGSGPPDFGATVEEALHAAAGATRLAMDHQERRHASRARA